jgi:hypothetical protein
LHAATVALSSEPVILEESKMVGPRPAGPPWTPDDDRKLTAMIEADMDKPQIARKLKRTVAAIISRWGKLRQLERRQPRRKT